MDLAIKNTGSGKAGTAKVADGVFAREFNEALVHQVVTAFMAGARRGTKAQKTRSDVRGGGAKPWRQKGTGRARQGTIRSPLWEGGGVTFAARPRDFSQKVNRKMYRGAMACILSELIRKERLIVVDGIEMKAPKTKAMVEQLKKLDAVRALIVVEEVDQNLFLSARNIPGSGVVDVSALDPVSLVNAEKVIITQGALKKVEEWLS